MSMSWAVGTSSEYVTHDPSPTGCGQFVYNFFTGEFIVFTGRIRATWLISLSFILPIVGLMLLSILVYKVPFVTNSRVGRWFLHGRPSAISWSGSFDPFLDKITLGAVSTFQSLTFCERLFLLLFFGMIAAFLQLSVREYYLAGKNWFLNFGFLTSVLFSLTFLPVSRTSIFLYSIGLPFERALKWHRLFACSAGLVMLIHAGSMIYDNRTNFVELLEQNVNAEGYGNFWGTLSGIALAPIFMFSIDPIRRRFFELFYYVHQLYLIGIVFAWIHSMSALYLGILPMTTHIADRVLRRYRSTRPVTLRGAKVLSAGDGKQLTEIRLFAPEMAHFEAGDYVFLRIGQISLLEWHPFTISSSPQEHADSGELTLHILSSDDANTFSARVANWAQAEVPQVMMSTLPRILQSECSLDGPYGRISLPHWHFEYTHIFLCAGGVGVTPMTSILSDLVYRHHNGQLKHVQSVNFVWVNQSSDPVLQWFPTLLKSAQQLGAPFELHLHVTGSIDSSSTTSVKPAAQSVDIEMHSKILPTHHRRDSRIAADSIAVNGFVANASVPVCDFDEYMTDEGIPYYVNKVTGESQWEEPVPKVQPALASSAKPINYQPEPSNAEKHVDKKHEVAHDFHIKAGRPDYLALFQRVACIEGIAGGCVMSCGPIAMVESIRSAAAQVGFDLHEESFLF
jgi:ferredoxin-NADP reductase